MYHPPNARTTDDVDAPGSGSRMSHAIVRAETPEEREYARYLAEIEARRHYAAEIQAELEALNVALGRFEAEYHARVGVLFVELDRVQLAIHEYERRITHLQTDPTADPTEVERDVGAAFAGRREDVRHGEEETRRYEQAFQRERERPRLDPGTEQEVQRLYRELARRFHPDLARTTKERRQREPLMQRVNEAMRARDLTALQGLAREAEVADPAFEARPIGEKLVWAIREVARLDGVIAGLEAELAVVRASDTHGLWTRQEAGERVLEALEADLTDEVAAVRDQLAELIVTYRRLLDRGRT